MRYFLIAGLLTLVWINPGFAHEHRTVADGYEFVVGFLNEPTFSDQMNGIDLRVSKGGQPVEGLEKTLISTVRYADQKESLSLPFKIRYKQPGAYAGHFLPAKPGKYTFEITGTLEGKSVHEIFESGSTFNDVEDSESLRWPKI